MLRRVGAWGLVALGVALLGVAVLALRTGKPPPEQKAGPPLPQGHDEARVGATLVDGFAIANIGPCTFQDTYAQAELLLGPPIGSFTGKSQDFLYGRLLCVPAAPPGSQVVLDNLGMQYLRLIGHLPVIDADPHPAVRSHILNAMEQGLEPAWAFGRIISPARCNAQGECFQFTDKQELLFRADDASSVRWAPLGCLLSYSCQRVQAQATVRPSLTTRTVSVIPWLAGLTSIGGGLLILRLQPRRRGRRATL